MARWRLVKEHYIHACPQDMLDEGIQWEYKETDRVSGRERRKRFNVPMWCETGAVVATKKSAQPGDYIYEGSPTPEMEPLDAEAQAITDEWKPKWQAPMSEAGLNEAFSNAAMLNMLVAKLAEVQTSQVPAAAPVVGVTREEFDSVRDQLAALMAENAKLKEASSGRRL